jgi:prepilin-type N-terminal cleavage/methylation domain-containing protein
MKRRASLNAGFSLVEMIVALGLFAIVIASSYSALLQGMILSQNARLESNASIILNNEMEFLRSLSWSEIEALSEKSGFNTVPVDKAISGSYIKTSRKADQFIVKLQISWTDANDRSQSSETVCILSKNGLGSL